MVITKLFNDLINSAISSMKQKFSRAKLQNNNPSCLFYPDVKIDKSTFEQYNVIFNNVTICNSHIGAHTYIQKNSRVFNAIIGKFCSIASNVSIAPGLHYINGVSTHPSFFLKNTPLVITYADIDFFKPSMKVTIGNDVWIGENAIILDGLTIGTGAVIAAGSVVTKDIEPYSIVGGVPAKVLKFRFSSDHISELLQSEWWNFSNNWFIENFRLMRNVSEFITQIKK